MHFSMNFQKFMLCFSNEIAFSSKIRIKHMYKVLAHNKTKQQQQSYFFIVWQAYFHAFFQEFSNIYALFSDEITFSSKIRIIF